MSGRRCPPSYACAGGPPDDWHKLDVFKNGERITDTVIEVNAAEGWAIRLARDDGGKFFLNENGDGCATYRDVGEFVLQWRDHKDK